MTSTLECSFCRKSEHQVQKLVAGPGVYICDECVAIASRIMAAAGPPPPKVPFWRRLSSRIHGVVGAVRHRALLKGSRTGHAVWQTSPAAGRS